MITLSDWRSGLLAASTSLFFFACSGGQVASDPTPSPDGGAGSGAGAPSPQTLQACQELCQPAEKVTSCPHEDPVKRCVSWCSIALPFASCAEETAFENCLDALGAEAYRCTNDGGAELSPDVCVSERQALSNCAPGQDDTFRLCSSDSECTIETPKCVSLEGKSVSSMCSRICDTDIQCPPDSYCISNISIGLDASCFEGCEAGTCPAGETCVNWKDDPRQNRVCVPNDWL